VNALASFCILAHCARSRRLGIGIASERMAIGQCLDGAIRPRIGAVATLGVPTPEHNRLALALLAQGYAAPHALSELCANNGALRHCPTAIVDREGAHAVSCVQSEPNGACSVAESGYVAMIDGPPGRRIVDALQAKFASGTGLDLDARLLGALEAADAQAPGHLRSAALLVYGDADYSEVDLRVDLNERPVAALRSLYDEYQPFAAYYDARAKNPREALPQREFADMLARNR
jgi:uncharacterized Ntn-hydrolase superfamily protein